MLPSSVPERCVIRKEHTFAHNLRYTCVCVVCQPTTITHYRVESQSQKSKEKRGTLDVSIPATTDGYVRIGNPSRIIN